MINEGKKILIKTNIHVISRSNEILGTDEISSKSEKNNPYLQLVPDHLAQGHQ